jgi:glycerophosphoryl diester phosphodiesterase
MKMNRPVVAFLYAHVILFVLLSSTGLGSENVTDSVKFVVISDLHLGLNETENTYKMFHYNDQILGDIIDDINSMGDVDFVIVPGDLTKDSEPYNHQRVLERLNGLNMPYYIVPGNHDVFKEGLPAENWPIEKIVEYYPMPWHEGNSWYSVDPVQGIHLVALDSSSNENHSADWGGVISQEQLDWLEQDLADNEEKTTIVVVHHALNQHESVSDPLYYCDNAEAVKEIMKSHDAKLAISGHIHITDIAEEDGLYEVSCPATCSYPCAYTVCELSGSEFTVDVMWYDNETVRDVAKQEFIDAGKDVAQAEGEPSDRNAVLNIGSIMISPAIAEEKLVIAHRGASGYLPEHTLEAYALAYGMGADYVEPDLVLTKDGVFMCLHDIHLERTTNVEEVFPDRAREDGRWYAADFTLSEIKQLKVHERTNTDGTAVFAGRFPQNNSDFEVPTFAEMIELIQGLNKATGRNVGIYPEIKSPTWHAAEGLPMEEKLLDLLAQYGYEGPNARIYVQSFENHSLRMMRDDLGTKLPLVQLVDTGNNSDTGENYSFMVTQEGLKEIATFADGVGPYKMYIEANPELVQWAHDDGLQVHTWTMRADSLPEKYSDFTEELNQFYFVYGVDGLFTDFTDRAVAFLQSAN